MKKLLTPLFFFILLSINLSAQTLRIEADALKQNQKNYKILDTRDKESYEKGHIAGAINFPITLTYAHKKRDGKLTNPFTMQEIVQNRGLNENDAIVVYDDGSFFDAARLFWALEVYGFKNVKLLNAGFKQWKNKHYTITTKVPKTVKSDYITIIDNNRLATKFATQIATRNPNQIIIDARSDKAYVGEISSAKRYGHIPKALNIPAEHNIDTLKQDSSLKSLSELAEIYKDIDKNKKVILYCAIGKISATNYFALRELGYNVANYDASWREWGNDFQLPVINLSGNNTIKDSDEEDSDEDIW